jgi:thiosulfate dehydrogenase [quinone] large subunit
MPEIDYDADSDVIEAAAGAIYVRLGVLEMEDCRETARDAFAAAGVAGSATGKSGASYGWWAVFLHNFAIPNASWIAKVVTLSELAIGALLLLGLFTGAAALAGLGFNIIYMFSGSAGVNPAYAIVALFLIMAWRNAGYFGLDRYALPMVRHLFRRGTHVQGATARPPTTVVPAHS